MKSLMELKVPHTCREVVDKGADSVLDEIETAILVVASSILAGEGFSYSLPNRSKGNQLYVPRPMSFSGSECTVRRMFYARFRGNNCVLPKPCFC